MEGNLPLKKGEFYIRELSVLQHEGILWIWAAEGGDQGGEGPRLPEAKMLKLSMAWMQIRSSFASSTCFTTLIFYF